MKRHLAIPLLLASALVQANPQALPVDSQWNGQTYAQLAAAWWQWAVAQPAHLDPLRDTTGVHCAQGQPLENPTRYRVATQDCFDLYARLPAGAPKRFGNPAATDGYWILLPPLPAGTHNLKFGGRYNRPGGAYGKTVQDIEYRLEIR